MVTRFKSKYLGHLSFVFHFQGQFWKLEVLRISKLSLEAKFEEEMAEKIDDKVAYPNNNKLLC